MFYQDSSNKKDSGFKISKQSLKSSPCVDSPVKSSRITKSKESSGLDLSSPQESQGTDYKEKLRKSLAFEANKAQKTKKVQNDRDSEDSDQNILSQDQDSESGVKHHEFLMSPLHEKYADFEEFKKSTIKKQKEKKVFKLVEHPDASASAATWANVDIASLLLSPSGQSVYGPVNRSSLYDLWNIVAQKSDSDRLDTPPSQTPPWSEPSLLNDSSSQESLDRSVLPSTRDSLLNIHLDPQEASELEALASLSLGLEAHMMDPCPSSMLSVKKTKTGRMFTLERKKPMETSGDSVHRKGRFTVEK